MANLENITSKAKMKLVASVLRDVVLLVDKCEVDQQFARIRKSVKETHSVLGKMIQALNDCDEPSIQALSEQSNAARINCEEAIWHYYPSPKKVEHYCPSVIAGWTAWMAAECGFRSIFFIEQCLKSAGVCALIAASAYEGDPAGESAKSAADKKATKLLLSL
jgi:hypothetical protein